MPSIKTALVICLCWVSRLTANPLYRTKEVDSVPAKEIHLLHRSEPKTVPNTNGKLCSSSDRLCKLHRRTQDFYIWKARPLEVILPLHHSAPLFWEFYIAIITQVSKQWSLQAPLPSFWIKQGTLELLFKPLERIGKSRITDQNGAAKLAVGVTQQIANNQSSKARTVGVARRTSSTKLGPIRLTSFKIHAGIVPVSAAAPYVKAFFDAIAVEASTAWASRPETELFTVTQGPLQLTMSCLGATIPWPTLVSVAQHFAALAEDSWINTFDAYYENPELAITLTLSLRILHSAATGLDSMTTSLPTMRNLHRRTLSAASSSSTQLKARTTPFSPGLKLAKFMQTAALVPCALAAAKLEDFYTIIALKIETGQFAHRAPSKTLVCSLWEFELTVSCDSIDVPLSFVQAFAIDMANWSSRQFTGFYEATVTGEGPLVGLVFLVRMRLKDKGVGVGEELYFLS